MKSGIIRWQFLLAVGLTVGIFSGVYSAHEVVLLSTKRSDGTKAALPVLKHGGHLSINSNPLDFGTVTALESKTLPLELQNINSTALEGWIGDPGPKFGISSTSPLVTTEPGGLRFTLGVGQSLVIDITFQPTYSGTVDRTLSIETSHAGIGPAQVDVVNLLGQGVSPGTLAILDPETLQLVSEVDFGEQTLQPGVAYEAPYRDLLFQNLGDAPMPQDLSISGFFQHIGGDILGGCSEDPGNAACLGSPSDNFFDIAHELKGLPGGESVLVRLRFLPRVPEDFRWHFFIDWPGGSRLLTVEGDVVPHITDDAASGLQKDTGSNPFVIDVMGPKLARGLKVDQVFNTVGDIDQINASNGNLVLTIPLGRSYPAGGGLEYQLQLSYNSNLWDRWQQVGDSQVFSPLPESNAGAGWIAHLGRLCEPMNRVEFEALSQEDKDKFFCKGSFFKYISPTGAVHRFDGNLHGSDVQRPDFNTIPALYSRDGSYLRLIRIDAATREVEFPDGSVHTFQRRELPVWGDEWGDVWRVTEIRDRNGKAVTIRYDIPRSDGVAGIQWVVSDGHRSHAIKMKTSNGYYPYEIDVVEVAAFGTETPASYTFAYSTKTVDRPFDNGQPVNDRITVPVLSTLTLPDGSGYSFDYYQDGVATGKRALRVRSAGLPTGGSIEWDYLDLTRPLAALCLSRDPRPGDPDPDIPEVTRLLGVSSRLMKDQNGDQVDEVLYSYGLYDGDGIQADYCDFDGNGRFPVRPKAEAVTAKAQVLDLKTQMSGETEVVVREGYLVTLNYFSVFPVVARPARNQQFAIPAPDGWTGQETGLAFTRNALYDPNAAAGQEEYLSTQIYECATLPTAPSDPKNLVSGCTLLRSSYVRYGQSPNVCGADESCSAANPRVVSEREVFHDDSDSWRLITRSDFDGLGHFRSEVVTASFGVQDYQLTETLYNPTVGTLESDGLTVTSGITLPTVWALNTWTNRSVNRTEGGGGDRRGAQRCWTISTDQLTLDRERTWTDNDQSASDVLVEHSYTPTGDRSRSESFGGDLQAVPLTTANSPWCTEDLPEQPEYTQVNTYSAGSLATSQMEGAPFFAVDRTIDTNTGLASAQRDVGGVETTFRYDSMGRVIEANHAVDATQTFLYRLPGATSVSTPEVIASQHSRGIPANVLTSATIKFDALGRVRAEIERQPDGTDSKRQYRYYPRGLLKAATALQEDDPDTFDATLATKYTYDALGRPLSITSPDDSSQEMSYLGIRQTGFSTKIGTTHNGGNPGTVTETQVTMIREVDPFGQVEKVTTPKHVTTLTYDSLGQVVTQSRTAVGGGTAQIRTFLRDGRGFLTSEDHPEKDASVTYGDYDALGKVGRKTDGPNALRFNYDSYGRLERLEATVDGLWQDLILRTYSAGRLDTTTRNHYLTDENTGNLPNATGTWTATEEYFYDTAGRVSDRGLQLFNGLGQLSGSFSQGWTYTPLGAVATIEYPKICDANFNCGSSRTVTYGYSWGALTSITPGNGMGGNLFYHPNGILSRVSYFDGFEDTFGLDPHHMPRPSSISLANGELDLGAYAYDGSGNIVGIGDHRYIYDEVSRLRRHYENGIQKDWFQYDPFDNLTRINGADQGVNATTNHLQDETYDLAGSQISDACARNVFYDSLALVRTYEEDPEAPDCPGTEFSWVHLYTGGGQRVLTGGGPPSFHWTVRDLNGKVLSVFRGAGPSLNLHKDYVYRGSGGPVMAGHSGGQTTRLHVDHLGTPRVVRQGSTTTVRHFRPFGEALGNAGDEDLQFTGHERDLHGETTHMQARTFKSARGRFFTTDPKVSTWNLYSYAENNPIRFGDPDGLSARDFLAKVKKEGGKIGFKEANTGVLVLAGGGSLKGLIVAQAGGSNPFTRVFFAGLALGGLINVTSVGTAINQRVVGSNTTPKSQQFSEAKARRSFARRLLRAENSTRKQLSKVRRQRNSALRREKNLEGKPQGTQTLIRVTRQAEGVPSSEQLDQEIAALEEQLSFIQDQQERLEAGREDTDDAQ